MAKAGIKKTIHTLLLVLIDAVLIFAASYGALFSRLEFQVTEQFKGFAPELLMLMPYSVVFGIVFPSFSAFTARTGDTPVRARYCSASARALP